MIWDHTSFEPFFLHLGPWFHSDLLSTPGRGLHLKLLSLKRKEKKLLNWNWSNNFSSHAIKRIIQCREAKEVFCCNAWFVDFLLPVDKKSAEVTFPRWSNHLFPLVGDCTIHEDSITILVFASDLLPPTSYIIHTHAGDT